MRRQPDVERFLNCIFILARISGLEKVQEVHGEERSLLYRRQKLLQAANH